MKILFHFEFILAPREGFEPPSPKDNGFRIHRNTGLCDLGSNFSTYGLVISMSRLDRYMRVEIKHNEELLTFESEKPLSISMILKDLEIPSSTVLAVYNDTIVPHSSIISEDISIELIVVSSGG